MSVTNLRTTPAGQCVAYNRQLKRNEEGGAAVNEEDVRAIVREEIAAYHAAQLALADQRDAHHSERHREHRRKVEEITRDEPGDGPVVRELKRTLRGEERRP